MRFCKKVLVVAVMGVIVAMAAEHEAHAGVIGHGAAVNLDAFTGHGVRNVYPSDFLETWTPSAFIMLDDGACIVVETGEKDGHVYIRTTGGDQMTWTVDGKPMVY